MAMNEASVVGISMKITAAMGRSQASTAIPAHTKLNNMAAWSPIADASYQTHRLRSSS